jgi:hypothetical protein
MHEIGRPGSVRHLCLQCADGCEKHAEAPESPDHGVILVSIGLFLLTLSILADWFRLGHGEGFGSWQILALVLALIVIGSGSVIRVSALSVLGWCLLLVTLAADYVGLDGRDGFGIRQTTGLLVAGVTIGAGIALGYVPRHRHLTSVQAGSWAQTGSVFRPPSQGKDEAE